MEQISPLVLLSVWYLWQTWSWSPRGPISPSPCSYWYYSFPLELPKIKVTDGREFIFESCHPFSTRRRHFHSSFNMRRNVLFNFQSLLCLPAPGDQAKINSIFMQDKVLLSESKPGYCPLGFLRSYIFLYLNQWLRKDAYDNQSLQVFTLRIKYVVL